MAEEAMMENVSVMIVMIEEIIEIVSVSLT